MRSPIYLQNDPTDKILFCDSTKPLTVFSMCNVWMCKLKSHSNPSQPSSPSTIFFQGSLQLLKLHQFWWFSTFLTTPQTMNERWTMYYSQLCNAHEYLALLLLQETWDNTLHLIVQDGVHASCNKVVTLFFDFKDTLHVSGFLFSLVNFILEYCLYSFVQNTYSSKQIESSFHWHLI